MSSTAVLTAEDEELLEGEQILQSQCVTEAHLDCHWENRVLYRFREVHGFRVREFPYTLDVLTTKSEPISTGCVCWESVGPLAEYLNSEYPANGELWLEIGSGIGLLALLLDPRFKLLLSDHSPAVLANARFNLDLHGKSESEICVFDWREAAPDFRLTRDFRLADVACLVGADVVWGRLGEVIAEIFRKCGNLRRGVFCLDTSKVDGVPEFLAAMAAAAMAIKRRATISDRFLLLDFARAAR